MIVFAAMIKHNLERVVILEHPFTLELNWHPGHLVGHYLHVLLLLAHGIVLMILINVHAVQTAKVVETFFILPKL